MPRAAEQLVLFPTSGWPSEDESHWILPVHAWVFHPEEDSRRRALLVRLLGRGAGIQARGPEAILLARRMAPFLVDNKRGRRPWVELGGTRVQLPKTDAGGHCTTRIELSRELGPGAHSITGWLEDSTQERTRTPVFLVDSQGLSIISDIDDTIKQSDVGDTAMLMRNTFTRSFETVEGMPECYQRWERGGAIFHYVSSSPWQLYEPLERLIRSASLPAGSMHLKRFRLKDRSILSLFKDPRETKPPVIQALLDAWPMRRFVLVGDSGELDPEVYGQISRDNPGRIAAICIRELAACGRGDPRYKGAFAGLDSSLWRLFSQPDQLHLPALVWDRSEDSG
jgi:phosphatidate phosphatase APP1